MCSALLELNSRCRSAGGRTLAAVGQQGAELWPLLLLLLVGAAPCAESALTGPIGWQTRQWRHGPDIVIEAASLEATVQVCGHAIDSDAIAAGLLTVLGASGLSSRCKGQLLCASFVVMVQARQTLRGKC